MQIEKHMPQPSHLLIQACILSLASNQQPTKNLAIARQQLSRLGKIYVSSTSVSPSDAKQLATCHIPSHTDYHNQVAFWALHQATSYLDVVQLTKAIEQQANRGQFAKPLVTLDIDIIAIQPVSLDTIDDLNQKLLDEKGQAFIKLDKTVNWFGVARRFPLPSYDKAGMANLARTQPLEFLADFI